MGSGARGGGRRQNRYAAIVGPGSYAKYAAGAPDLATATDVTLRAELHTLSYRLRLAYCITELRDQKLFNIRMGCFYTIGGALLAAIGFATLAHFRSEFSQLHYLFIALVGLAGAATSIARRADSIVRANPLDDDPIVQASALDQGTASLIIAGLCGPIFAMVMLFAFLSGQLEAGGLTPAFKEAADTAKADFIFGGHGMDAKSGADFAKLFIWAFLSGFAEQLVPDVLDRFSKAADKASGAAKVKTT